MSSFFLMYLWNSGRNPTCTQKNIRLLFISLAKSHGFDDTLRSIRIYSRKIHYGVQSCAKCALVIISWNILWIYSIVKFFLYLCFLPVNEVCALCYKLASVELVWSISCDAFYRRAKFLRSHLRHMFYVVSVAFLSPSISLTPSLIRLFPFSSIRITCS